jgi:broad specificity phosphatase PhoE
MGARRRTRPAASWHEPEPLSAGGREEVAAAAEWLAGEGAFARLLSSEMERARATAEILASALGLDYGLEPALNEPAFDGWVGKSTEQLKQDDPRFSRYLSRPSEVAIDGPLSLRALTSRAARATYRIAIEHPDGQVLLVSHADILRERRPVRGARADGCAGCGRHRPVTVSSG